MDLFFEIFFIVIALTAIVDFLIYKIPNETLIFLIAFFIVTTFLKSSYDLFATFSALKTPIIIFVSTLIACFIFYVLRLFGAGDAKLIATCSLWIPPEKAILFFILMTVSGGVLALIYLRKHRNIDILRFWILGHLTSIPLFSNYIENKKGIPSPKIRSRSNIKIPYGVAVFIGLALIRFIG